jgi:hypothetical protein
MIVFILLTTCLTALESSGRQGESRGRGGDGDGDGRVAKILNGGGEAGSAGQAAGSAGRGKPQ